MAGPVAAIITIHRFGPEGRGRLDPSALSAFLHCLRSEGCRFVSVREILRLHRENEPPPCNLVAFTIDDGYRDILTAARVFEELECPVTVFLATGFVDGDTWLWWDKVEYCMRRAGVGRFSFEAGTDATELRWSGPADAQRAAAELSAKLELLPHAERGSVVTELSESLGVEPPEAAPDDWAALSWDEVRELERGVFEFGPHTVTHPVLSRVGEDWAAREIVDSWARVSAEVRNPVPVLAYPNGSGTAFSVREVTLVRQAGLEGALTTHPWYALRRGHRGETDRFYLPRFAVPETIPELILVCSGLQQFHPRLGPQARV